MWQAVYVNIHRCCRFDVDVPGGPVLQESKSTAPGMTFDVVVRGPSYMLYGYSGLLYVLASVTRVMIVW